MSVETGLDISQMNIRGLMPFLRRLRKDSNRFWSPERLQPGSAVEAEAFVHLQHVQEKVVGPTSHQSQISVSVFIWFS